MPHELWFRLTAKARRLGYSRRIAQRLVRVLIMSVMLVCAAMGVLNVPGMALWERANGSGNPAAERFNVTVLPAAYGIHRL